MSVVTRTPLGVNLGPMQAQIQQAQNSANAAGTAAVAAQSSANAATAASEAAGTAVTAMQAQMASLSLRQVNVTSPALAIGTTNIPVAWPTPMPSAAYSIIVTVEQDASILGRLVASPVLGSKAAAGFTLAVTASGLVPIALGAATFNCVGIRIA